MLFCDLVNGNMGIILVDIHCLIELHGTFNSLKHIMILKDTIKAITWDISKLKRH